MIAPPLIVPVPVPALVRASVVSAMKLATTLALALRVKEQIVPVPEQVPPLQPVNREPAFGVAVRVIAVPCSTVPRQILEQLTLPEMEP